MFLSSAFEFECPCVNKILNGMLALQYNNREESCAIAKMTARCALYKWIE